MPRPTAPKSELRPPVASHESAAKHLARRHPEIRALRAAVGDPVLESKGRSAFESLARSIVFQQLAGAAAQTIWGRVLETTGSPINPARLNAHDDERLRACGLSSAKLRALRDLAERAPDLKLPALHRVSDEDIIARLTQVRGIGVWTAQMFLMFHLGRLDVWPTADLGVREGYRRVFGLAERPTDKELLPLGAPFQPYRSVAAWYMWRAVEVLPA
jgi:DNA-3-methyladenine glycosylase II